MPAPSVTFGVIGDWGWGPDGDYTANDDYPNQPTFEVYQKIVGKALGAQCAKSKCSFVLGTGDNFYTLGIDAAAGVYDPQWKTSWSDVYSAPSLRKIPFYHCLGNHDYGASYFVQASDPSIYGILNKSHSIWPQIEYTYYDTTGQWNLPFRYYSKDLSSDGIKVQLTVIDSNPLLTVKYCDAGPGTTYYGPAMTQNCQPAEQTAQLEFLTNSLKKGKAEGAWNLVMGHHPIVSIPDFLYPLYSQWVGDKLAENPPNMWFNGHDHTTAHFRHPNVTGAEFFTIGASGTVQIGDGELGTQSLAFNATYNAWDHILSNSGFAIVTLYKTKFNIKIYTANLFINDTTFSVTYDATFPKIN
jgi:hypothetical protein